MKTETKEDSIAGYFVPCLQHLHIHITGRCSRSSFRQISSLAAGDVLLFSASFRSQRHYCSRLQQLPSGPHIVMTGACMVPWAAACRPFHPAGLAYLSPMEMWSGRRWNRREEEWKGGAATAVESSVTCNAIVGRQCPMSNWIWCRCRIAVSCPLASCDFFLSRWRLGAKDVAIKHMLMYMYWFFVSTSTQL